MYFWNISALKQQLRDDKFTESDRFHYLIWYISFSMVGVEVLTYLPYFETNGWDYFNSFANILIPILGCYLAYLANGAEQGKMFIDKFIAISWVVMVRFTVYLLPLMLLWLLFMGAGLDSDTVSGAVNETELQDDLAGELVNEFSDEAYTNSEWLSATTAYDVLPFIVWYLLLYFRVVMHIGQTKLRAGENS